MTDQVDRLDGARPWATRWPWPCWPKWTAPAAAPTSCPTLPTLSGSCAPLILDDVPDDAHRTALATCAHATRTTQDLLTRMIGSRAPEVWTWLESRPYVRRGALGLYVHDVVRELFEAELAAPSAPPNTLSWTGRSAG